MPGRRPAGEEAGAEPQRLPAGALRQAHAGDAAREAEVVADHRAGAGLAADRLGLEADGGQALARGVHAGGQPGRARADHHEVDDLVDVDRVGSAVELVGQRPHVGAVAAPPGQGGHDRPPALVLRAARHHLAAHLAVGVVHAGRHPDPGEVVEQVARQAVLLGRDDADVLHHRCGDGRVPLVEQLADGEVELLVARSLRHEQQRVDLAGGDGVAEGLVVVAEPADVRDDQPPRGRDGLPGAADELVERVLLLVGVDDEERHLVPGREQVLGGRLGRGLVGRHADVVLALVAGEGLAQLGRVVGGGDDDRGRSHPQPSGRYRGRRGRDGRSEVHAVLRYRVSR